MTSGEPQLRSAAEAGDREAMAALARLLSATGRDAEANYWTSRVDELRWTDTAVPLAGRRYPPLVLLTAVLTAVLGLLTVALVIAVFVFLVDTGDELLLVLLIMLSLIPAAGAVGLLTGAAGMLRGSAAAARRAKGVAATMGALGVFGTLVLVGAALAYGGTVTAVLQALLLGAALAVPPFGVSVLLGRCIPRLGVTRRPTDR